MADEKMIRRKSSCTANCQRKLDPQPFVVYQPFKPVRSLLRKVQSKSDGISRRFGVDHQNHLSKKARQLIADGPFFMDPQQSSKLRNEIFTAPLYPSVCVIRYAYAQSPDSVPRFSPPIQRSPIPSSRNCPDAPILRFRRYRPSRFAKILVANRSESATRVVFSSRDESRDSPPSQSTRTRTRWLLAPLQTADEASRSGPSGRTDPVLDLKH